MKIRSPSFFNLKKRYPILFFSFLHKQLGDEDRFILRDVIEDDSFEVIDQSVSIADQVPSEARKREP